MKPFKIFPFILPILLLAGLACGSEAEPVADRPTMTPTITLAPTVTPTEPMADQPTMTPTITLAPTETPPAPSADQPTVKPTITLAPTETPTQPAPQSDASGELPKELLVGLGGDGVVCDEPPSGVELPAVEVQATYLGGWMCLWGFPFMEEVTIELYDPMGQAVASKADVMGENWSGVGVLYVSLCLAGQPTDEWNVVVESPTMSFEHSFQTSAAEWPLIGVIPSRNVDVFSPCGAYAFTFQVGDQVMTVGYGFPQSRDLALGIYMYEPESEGDGAYGLTRLVDGLWVTTDDQGNFEMPLQIESDYPAGLYFPVIILDDRYSSWPGVWDGKGATGAFRVTE